MNSRIAAAYVNVVLKLIFRSSIRYRRKSLLFCRSVGGHIEKDYIEDMFEDKGILYNVHYPINPEDVKEKGCDYVAALRKVRQSYEY